VFEALASANVAAEPAVYSDEIVDEVRDRLLRLDGVLVWVDPISDGNDRSKLDPMLREVAAKGAWVMIGEFMSRCEQYFALPGRMIDQPFRRRLSDGVIRCYMVGDEDAEPAPPNAARNTLGPRQLRPCRERSYGL
jgi:hypothetical protein